MANKRKWLEGELRYAEGKATASTLLRSIASELVEQGWVDYPRTEDTRYWGFNGLRQIVLYTETKQENIRLYEAVKNTLPNGDEVFSKGELIDPNSYKVIGKVIEGIDGGIDGNKTKQSSFVFIELVHSLDLFQQCTFVKKVGLNGVSNIVAELKSIPKGKIKLYKDTTLRITGETLLNKNNNNIVFNFARTPISMSKNKTNKLVVKVDGVVLEESKYTVDCFHGNLITREAITGVVTADYTIKTGFRKDEISSSLYSIMGNKIFANDSSLENEDVVVDVDYFWRLHYPQNVGQIVDRVIFKTQVDISPDKSKNAFKTFYWELSKFNTNIPTTKVTLEKMITYNNKEFHTSNKNLKLEDNSYTVYIDGVKAPEADFSIDRDGKVTFKKLQGGEVDLENGLIVSPDYQFYKLHNKNIIDGTLQVVANKGQPNERIIALASADINYEKGEIRFIEPVTGKGTNLTCERKTGTGVTGLVYTIPTNDELFKVENISVGGVYLQPSQYVINMTDRTITIISPNYNQSNAPTSITCNFETKTVINVSYKWSNTVEISYEYYPPEDSPLYDEIAMKDPAFSDYVTGIRSRFSSRLEDEAPNTNYNSGHYRLDPHYVSPWAKWSWYRKKSVQKGEVKIGTWTPVKFYMNFTQEYINVILQGEHSVDSHPYKNYIISHAYVGALENYQCSIDDAVNNFAMTVGSDELYNNTFYDIKGEEFLPELWGQKTGTGVTDILMEKTHANLPFQAHYPAFYTNPEFLDKHFISVSESTKKHHFSPITIVHGTERERGKMQGILIGDRSAIFHLDELIEDRDNFNTEDALINCDNDFLNKCGSPIESKEKKYIQFNINAPYWFANNSPNVLYGIAIRKS